MGPVAFWRRLDGAERSYLQQLALAPRQIVPADWQHWRCGQVVLGQLPPGRAELLRQALPDCRFEGRELVWDAQDRSEPQRSAALQALLVELRALGRVNGWRNERFSYWANPAAAPDPQQPAWLSVERAGFRYLGMMSHAVHINGFTAEGRVWCGRRAPDKATDPGLWDNVTAGGLPSGESLLQCALRELQEEAGLDAISADQLHTAGAVRTTRPVAEGLHDETLWVYNLLLPSGLVPLNRDGEVAEFACLQPSRLVEMVRAGEFTADAVQTLLRGLNFS
jgi:8-oxo-dGTP pyrophosphatase MutT (NUDIX family)